MKLELKGNMYYTRSSEGKIGFCREGNYTPEEYVKNCQKQGYDVIKASYNIINILEVGDYINGLKVLDIVENDIYISDYYAENYIGIVKVKDIKSVITHEQMEQMAYKVGE